MNLFVLFIILNVINVILQTAKSIATVKCGKTIAATANAAAYGLYTIVIIYTVCDLPLWQKVLIVAGANFVGVFVVKWIEQKLEKEKLWKVEMAIPTKDFNHLKVFTELETNKISYSSFISGKYEIFNCYCTTREQTAICQKLTKEFEGKISAYSSASLA